MKDDDKYEWHILELAGGQLFKVGVWERMLRVSDQQWIITDRADQRRIEEWARSIWDSLDPKPNVVTGSGDLAALFFHWIAEIGKGKRCQ